MNLLGGILNRKRKRTPRRSGFLRNAWVSGVWVVNVLVLFYAIENWRGARRFAEVKKRLEQHGANLDWKSFAPAPIPDEQNVAMHPLFRPLLDYEQIRTAHPKGGWTTTNRWLDSNGLRRLESVRLPRGWREGKKYISVESGARHPLVDLARWQTCFRHKTNFPSPAQPGAPAQDVLLALWRFEPQLRQLHEALERPHCQFPLRYDDRPDDMVLRHQSTLRGFAGLLKLRAAAQSALGEGEAALADTLKIFKLADCLKEPLRHSFDMRWAVVQCGCDAIGDGMMRGGWNDAQLLQLQLTLAKQDLLEGLALAMKGETASALQSLDTIRADGGFVFEGQFQSLRWAPRGWFDQNNAWLASHVYQHVMPAFDLTARRVYPATVNAEIDRLNSQWITPYSILALSTLSGLRGAAVLRAAYAQTACDQTLLACALERHRLATGCFPETLEALAAEYLSAVPRDVITGAPLGYGLLPDGGYRLWSAGWNERDEGGLVSTINIEEGDWVWERRIPN